MIENEWTLIPAIMSDRANLANDRMKEVWIDEREKRHKCRPKKPIH